MSTKKRDGKFFKGKYNIFFYDENDEHIVAFFNNIREILEYKKKDFTKQNYDLIKVELYRAQKRDYKTRMLDGSVMHVHLINVIEDD